MTNQPIHTTDKLDIALQSERNEEVQTIVERMPTRFGFWVSLIVIFIFILMAFFGWIVRYPDIVMGQIVVKANTAPIKLIANASGKIKLNGSKSMQTVKEGQIIAYLENPTNPNVVVHIDSLLKAYNPGSENIKQLIHFLPKNLSIGELNIKYYTFVNALQQYINHADDRLLEKQSQNLRVILAEQYKAQQAAQKRLEMSRNQLAYTYKFFKRDSTLFQKKVISEAELDRTQMSYIGAKDAYQTALGNLIGSKQAIQQTQSQLQELGITTPEKEKDLKIGLISSYNDLIDNIKSWEQKYVFQSPYKGKVQFLKFYAENQFIPQGEEVFTVIPTDEHLTGQVILPSQGSGKLKVGQEVIVKLDNFPYNEYGSVTGKVGAISLTTSTTKVQNNDIDTYLVQVDFPNQLTTNYGSKLEFRAEAKGSAEIVTKDRRLIERLFDNLKYAVKK